MHRDVYGLGIAATGDWPEVVQALDRDFAWFPESTGTPDAAVHIERRAPDRSSYAPSLEARRITWRSAEYRDGERSIVDYGRALAVDDGRGALTVEGQHGWTAWRAGYDFLLDRIDAHLETIDLVRINGLGLAGRQGGIVLLLPSGGGKTTLTLRALDAGVGLVSEGSPVLDTHGPTSPVPAPLARAHDLTRGRKPPPASMFAISQGSTPIPARWRCRRSATRSRHDPFRSATSSWACERSTASPPWIRFRAATSLGTSLERRSSASAFSRGAGSAPRPDGCGRRVAGPSRSRAA